MATPKYKDLISNIITAEELSKMFAQGIGEVDAQKLVIRIKDLINSSSNENLRMIWDSYQYSKGQLSSFNIANYPPASLKLAKDIQKIVDDARAGS